VFKIKGRGKKNQRKSQLKYLRPQISKLRCAGSPSMCSGKGLQSPDSYVAKCLLLARFNVHFVAFAGFNIHVAKYSTYKTFFFSIYSFDMQKLMSCFVG
jgi:hypothetical protein